MSDPTAANKEGNQAVGDDERVNDDEQFREEARAWLAEHAPAHEIPSGLRRSYLDPEWIERRHAWQVELVEGGWAAISWPVAYGGRDGTTRQEKIFAAEARRYAVPRGVEMSIARGLVAPTILAHGTDEQKARFLLPILRGDDWWCQLFSEPGAGSDLAGLSTSAVRDGDQWIVNGQKVWTSQAVEADYGMLLARTDIDQPKHRGITYFLIDMHQPGIEVRPLRQITGDTEFNEVFLTNAVVANDAILGEVNAGWGVAMTTLGNERVMMGALPAEVADDTVGKPREEPLVALARARGVTGDPEVRGGIVDSFVGSEVLRYVSMRMANEARAGHLPGPESSVMKLMAGSTAKKTGAVALAIEGTLGILDGADAIDDGGWQRRFLHAPSVRIAGGSDQIQRNVLGERVLGLPAEARVDKGVPFKDVPKNP